MSYFRLDNCNVDISEQAQRCPKNKIIKNDCDKIKTEQFLKITSLLAAVSPWWKSHAGLSGTTKNTNSEMVIVVIAAAAATHFQGIAHPMTYTSKIPQLKERRQNMVDVGNVRFQLKTIVCSYIPDAKRTKCAVHPSTIDRRHFA